jgi:hypothetical protein
MVKKILAVASIACLLGAQAQYDGTAVRISQGPNNLDYTTKISYTGTLVTYKGTAAKIQPTYSWLGSAGSFSITDAAAVGTVTTSAAHGLSAGAEIRISGVEVDSDLNGLYYIQTAPSPTTFTITTSGVTDATYTDLGMVMSTTAPRTTAPIWHITFYQYDGNNCTEIKNSSFSEIWDNRAATTGALMITYN